MSDQTTNLALPFLAAAQAQKHVTLNEGLLRLDALVQTAVESRSVSVEPASPADGAVWITPPGKTGAAWDAFADEGLAYYRDGAWEKLNPRVGWRVWVKDEARLVAFDGAAWVGLDGGAQVADLFRNPGFSVWQRGTSFASMSLGAYGPDGAGAQALNGHTVGMSRQATPAADRDLIRSPHMLRWSVTGPGSGLGAVLALICEGVETFANQSITIAFKAKGSAASTLTPRIRRNYGSGGSAEDTTSASAVSIATAAGLHTVTIALSSIAAKTIGANAYTAIELVTPADLAGAIDYDLADIQIIPGAVAPPFVPPDPVLTLARCQRYYERQTAGVSFAFFGPGVVTSSTAAQWMLSYRTKRAAPSIGLSGGFRLRTGSAYAVTGNTATQVTATGAFMTAETAGGLTDNMVILFQANNNSAAYIEISAELV